jgi:2-amino-4-hydroxy-6-hydroxymethyldihydropteridine diphosphokinase
VSRVAAPAVAYIGLGANLGDARATIPAALQEIARWPGIERQRASSVYRSAAIGAEGPDYFNAVAEVSTTLDPVALLDALQAIEARFGRQRPFRFAPRTLDLDLLLHGDRSIDTARLVLPHPRLHERAFVLLPLLELAPTLSHPVLGRLAAYLVATRDQRIERLG